MTVRQNARGSVAEERKAEEEEEEEEDNNQVGGCPETGEGKVQKNEKQDEAFIRAAGHSVRNICTLSTRQLAVALLFQQLVAICPLKGPLVNTPDLFSSRCVSRCGVKCIPHVLRR